MRSVACTVFALLAAVPCSSVEFFHVGRRWAIRNTAAAALLSKHIVARPVLADAPQGVLRLQMPERVVAVGDLHGDVHAFERVLRVAGLVDARGRWTSGSDVLVQVGDVLDRGDDEVALLARLRELKEAAAAAGGAVVTLLGNHEVLNAAGVGIYASAAAARGFEEANSEERSVVLRAGGRVARELAEWPVACVVGDTAFVHAGLDAANAARLEAIGIEAAVWLRGDDGDLAPPPEALWPRSARSRASVVWSRALSSPPSAEPSAATCDDLARALDIVGARRLVRTARSHSSIAPPDRTAHACAGCPCLRWLPELALAASPARAIIDPLRDTPCGILCGAECGAECGTRQVVGHTVQSSINAACSAAGVQVFRIDVGLSAAMGGAPAQALEIRRDGGVRVLRDAQKAV